MVPTSIAVLPGIQEYIEEGVYFLCHKGRVVYIGQSTSIGSRVQNHRQDSDKEFDRIYYLPLPGRSRELLLRIEAALIACVAPKYNRTPAADGRALDPPEHRELERGQLWALDCWQEMLDDADLAAVLRSMVTTNAND